MSGVFGGLVVAALGLGACIAAETPQQAADLRDAALASDRAFAILESLTTEVGPRLAGSENDARAVAWAKKTFTELGFDKVWTEAVVFPAWERKSERAEIVAPFHQPLAIAALGGSVGTGSKPLMAQVVRFRDLDALKNAPEAQVRGKVAFVDFRMAPSKDGSGYGVAVAVRSQGAPIAAAKGAKALLIRSIGTTDHRFAHAGAGVLIANALADATARAALPETKDGIPYMVTPIPAAALSSPDADLLARALEKAPDLRLRLALDVGYRVNSHASANVIGDVVGESNPEQIVLLAAHLDSWDFGTGALDDGFGLAVTMAATHLIKARGLRPKRTIRVVAFANEESGAYGARAYATKHAHEIGNHILGMESDFGGGRIWRLDSAINEHALVVIDRMMEVLLPLGVLRGNAVVQHPGTDINPLYLAGMPVLVLQQDGTHYFDIHHTANDTLDKVDAQSLKQNVAVYAVAAYLAAQMQEGFGPIDIPSKK